MGQLDATTRTAETGVWNSRDYGCRPSPFRSRLYTDVYSFELARSTALTFELTADRLRPALFLANDDQVMLEASRARADSDRVARVTWVLAAGTWHVAATKLDAGTDSYRLRITGQSEKLTLARVLFGPDAGPTNRSYNDYGANRSNRGGYRGGHAGWDVQTRNVVRGRDGNRLVNVDFYSLTAGEVIEVGIDSEGNTIIAVYDETVDRTTLYYHARRIEVPEGARVNVGTHLGVQGMVGNATGVHVHVELRSGERTRGASGASHPSSIDPIADSYLIDSVAAAWPVSASAVGELAVLRDRHRITASVTEDQYIVMQAGERRFKRLILNPSVLGMYEWRTQQEIEVSKEVLDAIPTSWLVWVVGPDGDVPEDAPVWHLRPGPDGNTGTRHHVTAAVFAQAGLEWDSVFKMSSREAALWVEGAALTPADVPRLRVAQGFQDLLD